MFGQLGGVFAVQAIGIGGAVGRDHAVELLAAEATARHHRGDLLLLDHLPVNERLDVRVVNVDDDHLGGAAGGAAALNCASSAVADAQEADQPARLAAAGERLVLAA